MIEAPFICYWPELYPRSAALLGHLRQLPMKRGKTPGGGANENIILGALPGGQRGPLEVVAPELYDEIKELAWTIDRFLHQKENDAYINCVNALEPSQRRNFLEGSIFTTGVIHKNYWGSYHKDEGCMPGTLVATLVLRERYSSGGATLCEIDDFEMPHGAILIFEGARIRHRVMPTVGGDRYSIVLHARRGL